MEIAKQWGWGRTPSVLVPWTWGRQYISLLLVSQEGEGQDFEGCELGMWARAAPTEPQKEQVERVDL